MFIIAITSKSTGRSVPRKPKSALRPTVKNEKQQNTTEGAFEKKSKNKSTSLV